MMWFAIGVLFFSLVVVVIVVAHSSAKGPFFCKDCVQYDWKPRRFAVTIWNGNAYCEVHYHEQFMSLVKFGVPPSNREIASGIEILKAMVTHLGLKIAKDSESKE